MRHSGCLPGCYLMSKTGLLLRTSAPDGQVRVPVMHLVLKAACAIAVPARRRQLLLVFDKFSDLGHVTFDRGLQILIGETFDQFCPAKFSIPLAQRAPKNLVITHDCSFRRAVMVRGRALTGRPILIRRLYGKESSD